MAYNDQLYLMHHGVKGMKWGHRKQRELKGEKRSSNESKKKWSTKKKIAVGAAIVGGTGLAAVTGYAIYRRSKNQKNQRKLNQARLNSQALKDLESRGKAALLKSNSLFYSEENKFGKVIAKRNDYGTWVQVYSKNKS